MYSATANRAFARGVEPLPVVHLVLQGGEERLGGSGRRVGADQAAQPDAAGAGDGLLLDRDVYSEGSYEDVLGQLTDGLAWASGWPDPGSDSEPFPCAQRQEVDRVGG
jgi:hypothetical protein